MKKLLKRIPLYGYIHGFVLFGLQYGIYRLGAWIADISGTAEHAFCPKIPFIDDLIPLIPAFVLIYIYSYVFWIMAPMAVSLTKKENFINYVIGYLLSMIIGILFFIFLPTYMDRVAEGLIDQMNQPGFFNWLLSIVYGNDGGNYGFNLFPSFHCMLSFYAYLGIRKRPEISKGFKIYTLVTAILIVFSTVFTKQHYFIDIIGGLSLAALCNHICKEFNFGKMIIQRREKKADTH